MPDFNQEKYYLGRLCKRGHEYLNTGKSLNYKSSRICIECRAITSKARAQTPEGRENLRRALHKYQASEHGREAQKAYARSDRGKEVSRAAMERFKQTEKGMATLRRAWRNSQERNREKRNFQASKKNNRRKYQKRTNYIPYTFEDLKVAHAVFGGRCVYCGGEANTRDHIIPLVKGGYEAVFNLVPACVSCNSSKQDFELESWYRRKPFFSEERLSIIYDYSRQYYPDY